MQFNSGLDCDTLKFNKSFTFFSVAFFMKFLSIEYCDIYYIIRLFSVTSDQ